MSAQYSTIVLHAMQVYVRSEDYQHKRRSIPLEAQGAATVNTLQCIHNVLFLMQKKNQLKCQTLEAIERACTHACVHLSAMTCKYSTACIHSGCLQLAAQVCYLKRMAQSTAGAVCARISRHMCANVYVLVHGRAGGSSSRARVESLEMKTNFAI